jgi:hypothetical protein
MPRGEYDGDVGAVGARNCGVGAEVPGPQADRHGRAPSV